jgi:hypothetical protein
MTAGCLPAMPGDADRAGDAGQFGGAEAARLQPLAKRRPLGLAADQADEGQVVAPAAALQAGGDDVEVLGVAEAHDQHQAAGRDLAHRALHRVGVLALHVGRHVVREDAVPAVDPGQRERQVGAGACDGMPDVAAAEQGDGLPRRVQPLHDLLRIARLHELEAQVHDPAAALAQAGP